MRLKGKTIGILAGPGYEDLEYGKCRRHMGGRACLSRWEPGVGTRGGRYPGLLPGTDQGAFRLIAHRALNPAGAAGVYSSQAVGQEI